MTLQQRSHEDNGLWLCQTCARKIDVDPAGYPCAVLNEWKVQSTEWAKARIGKRSVASSDESATESASPHLYLEHQSNYTRLYLDDVTVPLDSVTDWIRIQNITDSPLTHCRATLFAFKEYSQPDLFTRFYDINALHYIPLGAIDVGSLNATTAFELPMTRIYRIACKTLQQPESLLSSLLFPRIGEAIEYGVSTSNVKPSQAFTTNERLLAIYFHMKPLPRANALGGLPLKLVLDYRLRGNQYTSLLYGGTYYFAHFDGAHFFPLEQAVGFFVKSRYSLIRTRSHLPQSVIDLETEIHYRGDESHPADTGGRLSIHSVYEPTDGTGLERLVAVNVDNGLPQHLATKGHTALQQGDFLAAERLLTRCLALRPDESSALINRGSARYRLGHVKQAIADFRQAALLGDEAGLNYARQIGLIQP